MSTTIDQMMMAMQNGNTLDIRVNKLLDGTFVLWDKEKAERFGIHLSELTKGFKVKEKNQLCYRQHVFSKNYKPIQQHDTTTSVSTLRVFLEGWYVHLKWQRLFQSAGYAVEIEKTRYNPAFGVFHTPDIIAKFPEITGEDLWIVEIKSMSPRAYEAIVEENDPKRVHPDGFKQAQMYMYLTGYKRAMLLLENKANQQHREVCFDFDPNFVAPYVHRMNILAQLHVSYEQGIGTPKRVCESKDSERAVNCPMRHVCFTKKEEREQYRYITENGEQINSSLIHEGKGEI
ncbi:MAG TPA: hypothetical protein VL443_08185 [Cyclobacteriaceae bacterium]|jgi:hypothetical protein|nr:hypothetical protein [Cyclobacteriaceae bacterium]